MTAASPTEERNSAASVSELTEYSRLAVEPQQVVPGFAEATDWGFGL